MQETFVEGEYLMSVRVRYAPSPTGYQHIGGVRTALFNYFFARVHGGKFILRVEDTDKERYFDDALKDLYRVLNWLGINYDEGPEKPGDCGPYVQSERCQIYKDYAQELINKGYAYYCYCSLERLDRIRKIQRSNGMAPGYDRQCRNLSEQEREILAKECKNPVIRFKIPESGNVIIYDELFSDVSRACKDINPDPIILKSDGFPTYHLANVIDDHLMRITHVLRAQEWMPSASLHALLYQAFGWQMPTICHLPMVLGQDGQKLSKRHGAMHVWEFKEKGYLPEAIINYVSLLGWSLDDSTEIFALEDFCKQFSLKRLNKAPAVFDFKKLDWFNAFYLRRLTPERFFDLIIPLLRDNGIISSEFLDEKTKSIIESAIPLVQERVRFLTDVPGLLRFFFLRPKNYEHLIAVPKNVDIETVIKILINAQKVFENCTETSEEELDSLCRQKAEELGINLRNFLQPVRVALTGSTVSPPLVGSILILGKEESLYRMKTLEMTFKNK